MSKTPKQKITTNKDDEFKLSKHLTNDERKEFKLIGNPDMSQNWLELFTPQMIQDLITIKDSCSDNYKKADYIKKELGYYGFEVIGQGTNILPMINPAYPGVVFKIALDDCGIADNFNDCILQNIVPRYNKVFARDPSSMISVQLRNIVIKDPLKMNIHKNKILKLLKDLSEQFLIVDLSPDRFLNYGIARDGEFIINDGSDLYPVQLVKDKIRCSRVIGMDKKTHKLKRCDGKLSYNNDYSKLVCHKCGKEFNPIEFRPNKEDTIVTHIMLDGTTEEERKQLEKEEYDAIHKRHMNCEISNNNNYLKTDDDDDDDESQITEFTMVKRTHNEPDSSTDDGFEDTDEIDEDNESIEDDPSISMMLKPDDGLYIDIHGDFNDAWDESGIPIFISNDNGQTYTRVVSSSSLKKLIDANLAVLDDSEDEND